MGSLVTGTDQIRMVASTLDKAEGALLEEVHRLSEKVTEATSQVTGQLDATLKSVLDVGSSSLDTEAQTLATRLSDTLTEFEAKLKQDLEQAECALASITQETHNRIGELVGQLEDSVVDLGISIKQPADHILDRAAWNTLTVGAGLLLVLGLLVAVAVAIAAKGWPAGVGGLIAAVLLLLFVLLAGALTFLPTVKERALSFVLKGTPASPIPPTPEIFNVDPNPVPVGTPELPEINIHGVHLTPHGAAPVVTIAEAVMDIRGAGDHQITVAVRQDLTPGVGPLPPGSRGRRTVQLALTYPDKTTVGFPLLVDSTSAPPAPPPALITIEPDGIEERPEGPRFVLPSPVATQVIVRPPATIRNVGGAPSRPFQLTWVPEPGGVQITATVPPIPPGASLRTSACFLKGYTYRTSGTFQTEIRSNSREMDPTSPSIWQGEVVVQSPAAQQLSDPVLVGAQAVFRTWDDGKNAATELDVEIEDLEEDSTSSGWITDHRIAHGDSSGEDFANGSTKELDLRVDRRVKKSQVGDCWVKLLFRPKKELPTDTDVWRFDWSLRLTFNDDPKPQTIDFGSDELTEAFDRLKRKLPILSAMPPSENGTSDTGAPSGTDTGSDS